MNLAKAQACAAAISAAGFDVTMRKDAASGEWTVRAQSASTNIPVGTANSLAVAQVVTGSIQLIDYF